MIVARSRIQMVRVAAGMAAIGARSYVSSLTALCMAAECDACGRCRTQWDRLCRCYAPPGAQGSHHYLAT